MVARLVATHLEIALTCHWVPYACKDIQLEAIALASIMSNLTCPNLLFHDMIL